MLHIFDEYYYQHLEGGILEAFSRLLKPDVAIHVYPTTRESFSRIAITRGFRELLTNLPEEPIISVDNLRVSHEPRLLFRYLRERKFLREITEYREDCLTFHSSIVREQIEKGDPSWKKAVPAATAEVIERLGLFQSKRT